MNRTIARVMVLYTGRFNAPATLFADSNSTITDIIRKNAYITSLTQQHFEYNYKVLKLKKKIYVIFQFLTMARVEMAALRNIAPCSLVGE
jgi:hypothetical protein